MIVIDAHQDIALNSLYATGKDVTRRYKLHEGKNETGFEVNNNSDIPRLKAGGVRLVFSTIFSIDESSVQELAKEKPENYDFGKIFKIKTGVAGALEQFSFYHDLFSKSDKVQHVKTKKDYRLLAKNGRVGFLIHVEGVDFFGKSLEWLDVIYELGARSLALTWRNKNAFAGGNSVKGGLSKLGKELIKRVAKKNIVFDLAHANPETFWDVLRLVDFPVIVSHTSCRAIVDNSRNITDEQIKAIAKNGGVIGLAVIPDYIGGDKIADYIKHIRHIVELVGPDHVAFGTDFDGLVDPEDRFIKNFEDVSKYPNVLRAMAKEGFSKSEIEKMAYKNLERIILERLP